MNKIIYTSHFELFDKLTDIQLAQVIRKIGNSEFEITDPVSIGIWYVMERDFVIQEQNYRNKVEKNRENGKKGGAPKKISNPTKPTITQKNPMGYLGTHNNPQEATTTEVNPNNLKDKDKVTKDIDSNKDRVILEYQSIYSKNRSSIEHLRNLWDLTVEEAVDKFLSLEN